MEIKKIEEFISKEIRPHFNGHEGNIQIVSLEENILKFRLTGQCSNCPSAVFETEEFISVKIKDEFPQIKAVMLVSGVSDELIEFAKEILNKGKLS